MWVRKGGGAAVATLTAAAVFVIVVTSRLSVAQNISRGSFPNGFVFGTATSAYQVSLYCTVFISLILYIYSI